MVTDFVQTLISQEEELPANFLFRLSDLEPKDLSKLEKFWYKIPEAKRFSLLTKLDELANNDTILSFEAINRIAMNDASARVRYTAIRALLIYDLTPDLIPSLLDILTSDPDPEVRSVSALALGKFIYMGEVDAISSSAFHLVEEQLFKSYHEENNALVKMKIMEALGYSSNESINAIIQTAFDTGDPQWVTSALLAMGRSFNSEWKPYVAKCVSHPDESIRCEAIKSAGELEISEVVPSLVEALDDPSREIRLASIWSLSQIGGEGIFDKLNQLIEEGMVDEDEIEHIENALDNLSFNEEFRLFDLMDIPEPGISDADTNPAETFEDSF